MYYLLYPDGKKVPMPLDWYDKFDAIKWNENEKVIIGDTELITVPGFLQGQRNWFFIQNVKNQCIKGIISEIHE